MGHRRRRLNQSAANSLSNFYPIRATPSLSLLIPAFVVVLGCSEGDPRFDAGVADNILLRAFKRGPVLALEDSIARGVLSAAPASPLLPGRLFAALAKAKDAATNPSPARDPDLSFVEGRGPNLNLGIVRHLCGLDWR